MKTSQAIQTNGVKRSLHDDSKGDVKKARIDTDSQTFTLNSGQRMPVVQFGTYKMKGEECYKATLAALRSGYRGKHNDVNELF